MLDFSADDLTAASLSSSEQKIREIHADNPLFEFILNNLNNETVQPLANKIEQILNQTKDMKKVYSSGGIIGVLSKEV